MANISFGERMRRSRIKNAWTQAELGGKLGVSQSTIWSWESAKIVPNRDQKSRVRQVLGLDQPVVGDDSKDLVADQTAQEGPSAFGTWLNRARVEKGLSVAELATRAEISVPAIYNIEAGRIANPRAETIRRLEVALGKALPEETKEEIREEATVEVTVHTPAGSS